MNGTSFTKVLLFALVSTATVLSATPSQGATLDGDFGSGPLGTQHLWATAVWSRSSNDGWELVFACPSHNRESAYASGTAAGSYSGSGDAQYMAYETTGEDGAAATASFYLYYWVGAQVYYLQDGFTSLTTTSNREAYWTWG